MNRPYTFGKTVRMDCEQALERVLAAQMGIAT